MKLHYSIAHSFLIAGHTKFALDRSFGLIKRAFKVMYVSSLYEFAQLVETSSTSGLNNITTSRRFKCVIQKWVKPLDFEA